ncbi:hypothetical protein LCGC14_0493180 [marine sediment metagenome]|uniref:Uncharacterized protein n=1 Tax=marine sediment metagenome TaxID=412755 RepID=A0A0F9VET4_9ZZZZ|nr:MAG: hypothetical protein Lokiarch_32340 [Candidatus Lokiarchaeum sp. GC14_75]
MTVEKIQNATTEDFFEEILIVCPKCKGSKKLKLPKKIINQSKQLTTISIPSGLNCEHSFQAFVDKKFSVRGYQAVDFEFSALEFYESSSGPMEEEELVKDEEKDFTSMPIFQEVIQILRDCVDDKEILGSGIFSIEGKVLYSSLPQTTLFNTIREFEVRSQRNLVSVKKMYLELENSEKFISNLMEIFETKFNLVLMFSFRVKFGMGNLKIRDLLKKFKHIFGKDML